jgi:hypothetical protein
MENIPDEFGFIDGGIPEGKSLVYYIQPGVEGEIFGLQTAYNALKSGKNCIFIASSTCPSSVKSYFKEFGLEIDAFKNKLLFVDAYNPLLGAPSKEKYVISNPDNIYNFNKAISDLFRELPASTIVFGSLSTIMDLCGEKETIEAVKTWNKMAMIYGHVLIYNFTAWPYSDEILSLIKKDLFDAVVCIGRTSGNVIISQYFWVLKSDWIERKKISLLCIASHK